MNLSFVNTDCRAYDELVASARRSYASGNAAMLGGDSTASVPKYELHFLHNTGYAVEMTPLVLNREVSPTPV
jgi:hypothetical protein